MTPRPLYPFPELLHPDKRRMPNRPPLLLCGGNPGERDMVLIGCAEDWFGGLESRSLSEPLYVESSGSHLQQRQRQCLRDHTLKLCGQGLRPYTNHSCVFRRRPDKELSFGSKMERLALGLSPLCGGEPRWHTPEHDVGRGRDSGPRSSC